MTASVCQDAAGLRAWAAHAWLAVEPADKLERVAAIAAALAGRAPAKAPASPGPIRSRPSPGRPERPRLVDPRSVPARPLGSERGRAALLHAIAHIEFNAINLALDAAWRFERMPQDFLEDWLSVAVDEARHFTLIQRELERRGFAYGDFDAHDGLWQMAWKTRDDVLARMALVPRVLEARGLDATPPLQRRLRAAGDARAASILQVILDEEVRHVAIGNRWYHRLCEQRGLDPMECFVSLLSVHAVPVGRGEMNIDARRAAGFSDDELSWLAAPPAMADRPGPAHEA